MSRWKTFYDTSTPLQVFKTALIGCGLFNMFWFISLGSVQYRDTDYTLAKWGGGFIGLLASSLVLLGVWFVANIWGLTALGVILLCAYILALILFGIFFNPDKKDHTYTIRLDEVLPKEEIERTQRTFMMLHYLRDLDRAYMLDISEENWHTICSSENVLTAFSQHVTQGGDTASEFLKKTLAMLLILVQEMELSEDKFKEISVYCLTFISDISKEFDQEDIDNLACMYSSGIPDELSCLRVKINYELYALDILSKFAQEKDDGVVTAQIENIKKQRPYIDSSATVSTTDTTEDDPSWGKY